MLVPLNLEYPEPQAGWFLQSRCQSWSFLHLKLSSRFSSQSNPWPWVLPGLGFSLCILLSLGPCDSSCGCCHTGRRPAHGPGWLCCSPQRPWEPEPHTRMPVKLTFSPWTLGGQCRCYLPNEAHADHSLPVTTILGILGPRPPYLCPVLRFSCSAFSNIGRMNVYISWNSSVNRLSLLSPMFIREHPVPCCGCPMATRNVQLA